MSDIGQMIDNLDDNQAYYDPNSDTSGEKTVNINRNVIKTFINPSRQSVATSAPLRNKITPDKILDSIDSLTN